MSLSRTEDAIKSLLAKAADMEINLGSEAGREWLTQEIMKIVT